MGIILGIDVGTSSLGLTVRNDDDEKKNLTEQVIYSSVSLFNSGVGKEKNTEFSCSILQTLLKRKKEGIYDALERIGSLRQLSRIVIFWGEELKRLYFWGEIANLYDNAKYIYKSDYLKNFNINGVFVVHSSTGIELKNPDVHSDFSRQLIYSTIQCLIYDDDKNVTGMISFEKNFQRKGWTDDEVYDYTLFTKLIGEVLKNTI